MCWFALGPPLQSAASGFNFWYLDDGLPVCALACADILLRVLDVEVARVGASRETGNFAKSVARLVGTPAAVGATQAG